MFIRNAGAERLSLVSGLSYQGTWDASTNNPHLASGVGTQGYYYVVSVAGNTNLDGITDWQIGDWAIFNGTVWQKIDNSDTIVAVTASVPLYSSGGAAPDISLAYNTDNLQVTAGELNTIQDIYSGAAPTFDGANFTNIPFSGITGIVPLSQGGTASNLSDPNADSIMFWDDSAGAVTWLTPGNSIVITNTTIDTVQDIRTSASPTFANVHASSALYSDNIITESGGLRYWRYDSGEYQTNPDSDDIYTRLIGFGGSTEIFLNDGEIDYTAGFHYFSGGPGQFTSTLTASQYFASNSIRQFDVSSGVTLMDFNFQVGSTPNADRVFRYGCETNTGTGTLSSAWYLGNNTTSTAMTLNHKLGDLGVTRNISTTSGSFYTQPGLNIGLNDVVVISWGADPDGYYDNTSPCLYWSNPDVGHGALILQTIGGSQLGFICNSVVANYLQSNGSAYVGSSLTVINTVSVGSGSTQGVLDFNSTTANRIQFGTSGVANPGASSAGMKIKLYGADGAMNTTDYALGIASSTLWVNTGADFRVYVNSSTNAFGWSNSNSCFWIGDPSPPSYARLHVENTDNPVIVLEDTGNGVGYFYQNSTVTGFGAETSFDWKTGVNFGTGPISSGTSRMSLSASLLQVKLPFQTTADVTFTLGDANQEWLLDYDSTSISDTPITWNMDVASSSFGFTFIGRDWNINHGGNAGTLYGTDLDIASTGSSAPPQILAYTVDMSSGASNTNFNKGFAASLSGTNMTSGAAIYGSINNAANTNTQIGGKWAGYFDGPVYSILTGGFNLQMTDTISNSTLKQSFIVGTHYTNTEEPMGILYTYNNNSLNLIRFGGGHSATNATTRQEWYTAANATTVTGTRRGYVNSAGNWFFGAAGEASNGYGIVNIERQSTGYDYSNAALTAGYQVDSSGGAFITYLGYNTSTGYGFIDAVDISGGYAPIAIVPNGNRLVVGLPTGDTLVSAKLEVVSSGAIALATHVNQSNDDNRWQKRGYKTTTTNNSQTTLATIATTTDTTFSLHIVVTARRTGGVSGSNGDAATYERTVNVRNIGGTVTVNGGSGAVDVTAIYESQSGWAVDVIQSSTNVLIRVTGATNNNVSWWCDPEIYGNYSS